MDKIEEILNGGNIAQVEVWEYTLIIHLKNGDVIEVQHGVNDKLEYNLVKVDGERIG